MNIAVEYKLQKFVNRVMVLLVASVELFLTSLYMSSRELRLTAVCFFVIISSVWSYCKFSSDSLNEFYLRTQFNIIWNQNNLVYMRAIQKEAEGELTKHQLGSLKVSGVEPVN